MGWGDKWTESPDHPPAPLRGATWETVGVMVSRVGTGGEDAAKPGSKPSVIQGPFSVYPPSFVTTHCALQFSSRGIRPGLTTVLARNLDKNTVGYLQWRWGVQSAMNTSIVRDTKTSHFTVALQVRTARGTLLQSLAPHPQVCCLQGQRQVLSICPQELKQGCARAPGELCSTRHKVRGLFRQRPQDRGRGAVVAGQELDTAAAL